MPDIDFQRIELNLIPKGVDEPVIFYASQYESARPFIADLFWGDTEFAPGDDCWAEIDIRKNDNNLVVITDDVAIDNNEVSVILPVQALTCIGKNFGQVKIYAADDQLIAALNFIIEVQPDPLAGGVDSESAIDNLESQIAAIVPEVIGEDYYDKTEVDDLLADKADVSDLPDMSQYYNKTQTDNLLADKADVSDLPDMSQYYNKTQTDNLLADKADVSDLPDMTQYYTKTQVDNLIDNIFPTFTASGAIATFTTALTKPLVSVTADPLASSITRCGVNLCDVTANEAGGINSSGEEIVDANNRRSSIYYPISAGITITMQSNLSLNRLYFYDENKNFISPRSEGQPSVTAIAPANAKFFRWSAYKVGITESDVLNSNMQIELGSIATAYESYNGQTVPVADATTLTTLSGVNNVFADSGDVTVQYKYMSM